MDTIMDLCFLCTTDYDCVPIHEKIVSQVEYLLPEITIIKLGVPLRICFACDGALCAFSKFKQSSVESSRRLEASIKGAQGLPLHTGSPSVVDDNETSVDKPEKLEETSVKEEYVEETPLDTQMHTDRTFLIPNDVLETISVDSQNQLHKDKVFQWWMDDNKYSLDKPEIFIKEERVEEKQMDTPMHTDRTSPNPVGILETVMSQNMQLHTDTNADNTEEIMIKKEQMEQTPQDRLYYNKILKEECVSNSTNDDTDIQPEHNTKDESATFNTSEEVWEGRSPDLKEETVEETEGNYSNNIQTDIKIIIHEIKHQDELNKKIQENKEHRCNVCTKLFASKVYLTRHMKENHWRIRNSPCTVCKKVFNHKYDLSKHMDLHKGIKKFQCSMCKTSFCNNIDLKHHMKLHTERKENKTQTRNQIKDSLRCPTCNKKFKYKCLVQRHLKIHTGEKDFQCGVCNKSFTQNSNLKKHIKTHSGLKDFQCDVCNKSFTLKDYLNRHMKFHTGVKDFQCSVCNKSFTEKGSLNKHMKIHTGVKDFQCCVCNKSFTRKDTLKWHLKSHTGVKDFQCAVCHKLFTEKGSLINHMKIHTE